MIYIYILLAQYNVYITIHCMPYGTRFSYILSKKTKKGKGGSIAGLFPQEGHKGFRCVRPSNLLAIACSSSLYSSMHNGQRSIFIQYKNKLRKFTSITCWVFFATFWKTKLDHCVCTDCCIYIYHGMFFQQQHLVALLPLPPPAQPNQSLLLLLAYSPPVWCTHTQIDRQFFFFFLYVVEVRLLVRSSPWFLKLCAASTSTSSSSCTRRPGPQPP